MNAAEIAKNNAHAVIYWPGVARNKDNGITFTKPNKTKGYWQILTAINEHGPIFISKANELGGRPKNWYSDIRKRLVDAQLITRVKDGYIITELGKRYLSEMA